MPGSSGNRTGQLRATTAGIALSTSIRAATQEGLELVNIALEIARDPEVRPADRLDAVEFLATRGFGRPTEVTELRTEDGVMVGVGVIVGVGVLSGALF